MIVAEVSGISSLSYPVTNILITFNKENFMNLANPVTIQPPTITRASGEVRVQKPITITELDVTIIDNAKRKSAVAQVRPCPYPLVLWTNEAYEVAGDYTQSQVEARVLELLGSDVKVGLEKLFVPPAPPVRK